MINVIILIIYFLSTVTCEYVSGYSNVTSLIYVNGTEFWIYSSDFPTSYNWIYIKDTCSPTDPRTCAYMGDNFCCGTWTIDYWYEQNLKYRIAQEAYGNSWYGDSYFNSYSGWHCELNPEFYDSFYQYSSYYKYDSRYMWF